MNEKFGQVYFKASSGSGSEFVLMPSIRFSNLDHRWYDKDGNIHFLFEKYRGENFSLRFNIQQRDKNGLLVPFEGNIQPVYQLGEVGDQDFEGATVAEKEDLELVHQYGILPNEVTFEQNRRNIELSALLAASLPGCKLRDAKIHRKFSLAFFAFDDYMDKLPTAVSLDQLKNFLKISVDVLDGKEGNLEKRMKGMKKTPETLLKFIKFIQHFHQELSKAEGGDTDRGFYVRETVKEYLQAVCHEVCTEWNAERTSLFDKAQKDLRVVAGGAYIWLEMPLFDFNIQVKPEIRNTFLFKWFVKLYAEQLSWLNDIISLRKVLEAGDSGFGCNKVYILHHSKDLPLHDALKKVLDTTNDHVKRFVEAGRMLTELYKEDENVRRFVKKAKDLVHGHIQWIPFSERYHKNLVFDCVVDEKL